MRSYFKPVVLLSIILGICTVCYLLGRYLRVDGVTIEGLAVTNDHLFVGEVIETDRFMWTLPITNLRNEDVVIERFETSCGCGKIEPTSLVLSKSETRTISLTLNLRSSPINPSALRRNFSVQIIPVFPGKQPAQRGWIVHGQVVTALSVPTQLIHFQDIEVDKPPPTLTCLIYSTLNKDNISISSEPPLVNTVIKPIDLSKVYELHVTPKDSLLREGSFECKLTITAITNQLQGSRISQQIIVRGKVHGTVRVFPEDLTLGTCQVGQDILHPMTLLDSKDSSFTYDSLDTSSPCVTIQGVPQKKDNCLHIVLRVSIREIGPCRIDVSLRVRRGGLKIEVPVSIVYHGIQ